MAHARVPLLPEGKSVDLPPAHLRSARMYNQMDQKGWGRFTSKGKHYLSINGENYQILDGLVTEFKEQMVSIGAGLSGREILVLKPTEYLKGRYLALKQELKAQELKLEIKPSSTKENKASHIEAVLQYTMAFVRRYLDPSPRALEEEVETFCKNPPSGTEQFQGRPLILLDHFIQRRRGLCRHHALFLSYLLHHLIQDGLLPEGNVYHHRDNVRDGAHVWAIYKPKNSSSGLDFYLADSLWDDKAYNVRTHEESLGKRYGEAVIKGCFHRYINFKTLAYTEIKEDADQKSFIRILLEADPLSRRTYLNYQHKLNACQLIQRALISNPHAETARYYTEHRNYHALLNDIKCVLNTSVLHQATYDRIIGADNRQQYVLGLLCASASNIDSIIGKQNLTSLEQLSTSLQARTPDRRGLFKQFDTYGLVSQKVADYLNRLQKLELIRKIKNIILSKKLKVLPGWAPCFWTTGKQVITTTGPIRVPTCIKAIYEKINKIDLERADVGTLDNIMSEIQKIATKAAGYDHRHRDLDTTQRFLTILKNAATIPGLLADLNGFHPSPGGLRRL